MAPSSHRFRGFSLIEIVIALGIFSFAVVGIIGLMSVGISESALAKRDTMLASMVKRVIADISANPAKIADATNIAPYFFSYYGQLDSGETPLDAKDRYYRCDVKIAKPSTPWDQKPLPLTYATITFKWPEGAPEKQKQTATFETTFAQ